MLSLDHRQVAALRKVILRVFSPADFDILLQDEFDIPSHAIAAGNFVNIAHDVIVSFKQQGKDGELVRAILDARGQNPEVQQFLRSIKFGTFEKDDAALQALVREEDPAMDLLPWLADAEARRRQICQIGYTTVSGSVMGTGFLIGPDLVMTNYHVIGPLKAEPGQAGSAVLTFDYTLTSTGDSLGTTRTVGLAADWLVDCLPPADGDVVAGGAAPTPNELDFAVLRIAQKLGDEELFVSGMGHSPERKWVDLCQAEHSVTGAPGVMILQHPKGNPLKVAFGRVTSVVGDIGRLRYDTETQHGSSGAPVFDMKWRLVGLHHAGDPQFKGQGLAAFNQAILMKPIRDRLVAQNVISC